MCSPPPYCEFYVKLEDIQTDCIPVCSLWFRPTHLAAAGTSMHESGANHVGSEEVGVGIPADPVIDDGLPQALQPVGIVVWGAGSQISETLTLT